MKKIIVLAAWKGKRMEVEIPKVLVPIKWKPMIQYLIKSIIDSEVDNSPILVVSPDNIDIIKNNLKEFNCSYTLQDKQLWTGHAVSCAQSLITEETNYIICLYWDHPFIKSETIKKISENQTGIISIITTKVDNFETWQKNFYHWWRIIRENWEIKEIVEFKDTNDEQKEIKEVNPAIYCFNTKWLWENINKLKNNNAQQEYYLTDLIKIAFEQKIHINSFQINPKEAMGINSREELEIAESII